jgi:hypothetical protein
MARHVYVLEEILAILQSIGAAKGTIENFRRQAEAITAHKAARELDDVVVSSGFGVKSQRGTVDLTINDQNSQMGAKKAREIGLMLIEAAEAATSDEIVVTLLKRIGITEPDRLGHILVDLREIRQGTRGIARPS